MIREAHDKNLLVPFAERLPNAFALPWLAGRLPHAQQFGPGRDTPPLPARPVAHLDAHLLRVGGGLLVRRMVREARPHLIVTLANDAWFGDSQEAWIHLQVARLRAVEHRRYLVHATNSGVTGVVDPLGRLVVRSGPLTRENLRAEVRMVEGETLYGRLGDWPGALAIVALLVTVGLRRAPARTMGRA